MTLKDFCKKYGLTEDQATGKEHIGGGLYLGSVTSIPEVTFVEVDELSESDRGEGGYGSSGK